MEFKFYYNILGVSKNADEKEIRKAYLDLAKKFHSDMNVNKSKEEQQELEDKLKEATEAYTVLKNPETRKAYDLELIKEVVSQALKAQQEQKEQQSNYEETESVRTRKSNITNLKPNRNRKSIKDIYREVRKIEAKNSFLKRHEKINEVYDEMYASIANTNSKSIIFHFEKGTVNVMHELYYQLKKLSYITEDSIPKYILRNRKLFTTVGLAITIGSLANDFASNQTEKEPETETTTYIEETEKELENMGIYSIITLNRVHEIEMGETLSQIAVDSGNSENDLKTLNNLPSSGFLYEGDEIVIPYEISANDLQYYTSVIDTKSKSIYDLAKEYETDTKTLYQLNEEAITKLSNTYIILTDEIIVPNFITKKELKELKETSSIKKY